MRSAAYTICLAAVCLILAACSATPKAAGGNPDEVRKLLAEHETVAVLDGVDYRLCRGLTARCPKECGDSGEVARFRIVGYIRHAMHDPEFGREKQDSFFVQISDYDRKPVGDPKRAKTIRELKPGDYVLLSWRHDYVTREGASFPERPITKLEPVSEAKAKSLIRE